MLKERSLSQNKDSPNNERMTWETKVSHSNRHPDQSSTLQTTFLFLIMKLNMEDCFKYHQNKLNKQATK